MVAITNEGFYDNKHSKDIRIRALHCAQEGKEERCLY